MQLSVWQLLLDSIISIELNVIEAEYSQLLQSEFKLLL